LEEKTHSRKRTSVQERKTQKSSWCRDAIDALTLEIRGEKLVMRMVEEWRPSWAGGGKEDEKSKPIISKYVWKGRNSTLIGIVRKC